jgi:phosphohistidine phosphatase
MAIYLIRHAHAYAVGEHKISSDADRMLTPRGERQALRMGRLFEKLGVMPRRILCSPLRRAHQTAESIASTLHFSGEIELHAALALPADAAAALALVEAARHQDVLVVGHQPHLGSLLCELLTGHRTVSMPLSKCSVSCVQPDPELYYGYRLQWILNQKLLKSLL